MKCFLVTNKTILAQEYTSRVSSPRFQMSLSFFFVFGCVKPRNTRSLRLNSMWTNPSDSSSELEQNGWKKNQSGMSVLSIFEYFTFDRKFVGPG